MPITDFKLVEYDEKSKFVPVNACIQIPATNIIHFLDSPTITSVCLYICIEKCEKKLVLRERMGFRAGFWWILRGFLDTWNGLNGLYNVFARIRVLFFIYCYRGVRKKVRWSLKSGNENMKPFYVKIVTRCWNNYNMGFIFDCKFYGLDVWLIIIFVIGSNLLNNQFGCFTIYGLYLIRWGNFKYVDQKYMETLIRV